MSNRRAGNLLLLTATPHHGDDDRFSHFIRLLDPDIFPEPHRVGEKATEIRRDILSLGAIQLLASGESKLKEDAQTLNPLDHERVVQGRAIGR